MRFFLMSIIYAVCDILTTTYWLRVRIPQHLFGYHNTPLRLPQHPPPVTTTPLSGKVALGNLLTYLLYSQQAKLMISKKFAEFIADQALWKPARMTQNERNLTWLSGLKVSAFWSFFKSWDFDVLRQAGTKH
jgi:hypothetical protein